jgi:uroporphyrinogen-III synthase
MTRVLVLRPEPGASATVTAARELGLEPVAIPLFEVKPVSWQAPDASAFDGLLLTSANAIRHGGEQLGKLRGLKAYAVGNATAEAARDAGFDIAATGDAGVDSLLSSIEPDLKLLHLCGVDRQKAEEPQQEITRIEVYLSREVISADLPDIEGSVALIHSPRASRRLADLVEQRGSIRIAAISWSAADAAGKGWMSIDVAEQPNDDALLALAARLCNNSQPK